MCDRQVYKRVHRIGQKNPYTIWLTLAIDSPDEQAVSDRAQKKSMFIDKAYELKPGEGGEEDEADNSINSAQASA